MPDQLNNYDKQKNTDCNFINVNMNISSISPMDLNNSNPLQIRTYSNNPEDKLMDQNFWDNFPTKNNSILNNNLQNNQEINNINKKSLINNTQGFNFSNLLNKPIPEFNFEAATKIQQYETSTNKNLFTNNNHSNIIPTNLNTGISNGVIEEINTIGKLNSAQNMVPNSTHSGDPLTNLRSKADEHLKKNNKFDVNFSHLLDIDNTHIAEDDFDLSNIKKQIRGAIIVIPFFFNF